MKFTRFASLLLGLSLFCVLAIAGCGRGIQSDLRIKEGHFNFDSGAKAKFVGTVENTGQNTYSGVFIVLDMYEGDQYAGRLKTTANLPGSVKLEPGKSTSFDKEFEDGGYRPNRYEVVRLYGVQ
jgi:hypothetical protein